MFISPHVTLHVHLLVHNPRLRLCPTHLADQHRPNDHDIAYSARDDGTADDDEVGDGHGRPSLQVILIHGLTFCLCV